MADEKPKDYSSMYCEDSGFHKSPPPPPLPSSRGLPTAPTYNKKLLDGSFVAPRHREQFDTHNSTTSVCLRQVVAKLENLPKENHRAYAMDTLNKHYSSVFVNRRKASFKAYIQYFDEKETYVVRADRNTLRAVKDKLPKRGNYRFFFKHLDNTCEEAELDDSIVPFHEKDGLRQIYCQVFPL